LTANNSTGTQLFAGSSITSTTTLYVYNEAEAVATLFKVTIADLNSITPPSASYCSQYRLTALPYARYFTQSGGQILLEQELTAGTIINTPGPNNIYVWFEQNCNPILHKEKSFTITIIPQHCLIMLTSLIATPTHSRRYKWRYLLEQIRTTYSHQAPLLQALNQYLFIKKRQQYH
jgi:hypothetical protein